MSSDPDSSTARLVLASSSPYRRQLLQRLQTPFVHAAPNIDESPRTGETVRALVSRLAHAKARAIAKDHPNAVIIGSDQVATRGDTVLGKPGSAAGAREQLLACSDQEVSFLTSAVVIDPARASVEEHLDETRVSFRTLQPDEIDRYIAREKPYDCAGGFKVEKLGITLFWRVRSDDPTALTGLPLIWVASALRRCGFDLP
ncbi:MAG: septum formation protein Maf [Gammaproteobacteria bacterium]|nr:septum formation protein Maf [Gammaproteobacteria bacterium]NND61441.1 septum formation protein Maf [Gammaproteobacteria bacterium]